MDNGDKTYEKTELAESLGQKSFSLSVLNLWFNRSPAEEFLRSSDLTQSIGKIGMLHLPKTIKL